MKKTNKRGFTIVELVIVIAVIAILAAVLIPNISRLVKKANESADIQAVRQMNTQLAMNEVTEGKSITEVHKALSEGGMTSKDYHPLVSNTYFFWDADENRVLYTDKNYKVLYPEEYKGKTFDAAKSHWYSLSGEIEETKVSPDNSGVASVSNAGELYYATKNYAAKGIKKIQITGNINAMGADLGIREVQKDTEITIEGQGSGATITGMTVIAASYTETTAPSSLGKIYGTGLVQHVVTGGTVTLKNITIQGATIGDLETGSVGALVGKIDGGEITIENCKVIDTVVYGKNKVGGLIGGVGSAKLDIKNCSLEKVTVNCSEGESGKAIGCIYNSDVTIDKAFNEWVSSDCSLNLVKGTYERKQLTGTIKTNGTARKDITCFVEEISADGTPENEGGNPNYRLYAADAYATIQTLGVKKEKTVTIGGEGGKTFNSSNVTYTTTATIGTTTVNAKVGVVIK